MKNPFKKILKDVNMAASIIAFDGPLDAAEKIVEELQDAGPSWSGRYSNSWEIEANGNTNKGNGNKGNPRRIKSPRFSQSEMKKLAKAGRDVPVNIRNFSPDKGYAQDELIGRFRRGKVKRTGKIIGDAPYSRTGREKLEQVGAGRGGETLRYEIGGGDSKYVSSRTAPQNWFGTYKEGGQLQKTIKLSMNRAIAKAQKRFGGFG